MKKLSILLLGLAASVCVNAADMKDLKIYVNPGHGGHDSDDRWVEVPPFTNQDPNGFWESNSNLVKGLDLRDMLESFGANVMMSRTTNTTEDDRDLHEIGYEANAYAADFFFSIHSNATGTSAKKNQPLMLYRGFTDDPVSPEAKVMSGILNKHLLENRITSWSSESQWLAGDYDFYDWGVGVGLGVLRKLTVPGMLSEGSYHDYIPETYRLLNNDFCWLEAYHFTKAVMEYFETPEKFTTGVVGGAIYDNRLIRTESIYNGWFFGHDEQKPICGATVELLNAGGSVVDTYETDALFNGVYLFKNVAPGSYTVKVSHPEYEPYESDVVVTANEVTYNNVAMSRIRNTPPEVVSYSPVWAEGDETLPCNTPIVLEFNWDMDTESVENNFSITPAVDGALRWEDSQYRLVFEPARAYETNTVYTVRLGKDAMHPAGMKMENDFEFSFKTSDYNTFEILAINPPKEALVHYDAPVMEFRFPHQPNTQGFESNVVITDSKGTALSYNSRSRKYSKSGDDYGYFQVKFSKDFTIGETYTVNVGAGMCDEFGIKIAEPFSYQFTAVDAALDDVPVTLVEAFDATDLLAADESASAGCASLSAARNTATKLEGTSSYKLSYAFANAQDGVAAYKFATAPATAFTNDNMLMLKVYGDLSCNKLNAVFVNGSEEKTVTVCNLDFLGWQNRKISLAEIGEGEWTLSGLEIEQTGEVCGKKGDVYVDKAAIGAAEDAGVADIQIAGLRMYPNPASELLIANADRHIAGIELISMDGRVVASAAGNVLNVSEVANGVYIAKVYVTDGFSTKQVIVRH